MLESIKNNRIQYQRLSEEECQKRQILGTLAGPCADIQNPTRNGRTYSEKLWETVFDAPLVKEQFKAGGIFGELEHPDYDNVNPEKIAVIMPEPPKKADDGLLYGYWHILNTPNGKILKTLVDYGYKVGVSTRGNGDVIEDKYGNESVDPETYQLNALDIVLIPAVEKARLDLVESVQNKKTLKESLSELVNNSSDEDKKIMNESLAQLNITLTSENAGEAREVSIPVDMTVSDDGDVKIETVDTIPEDDPGVIGETPEVTVTADVVMQAQSEVEQEVEAEVADDTVDNSTEDDNIQVDIDDEEADDVGDSLLNDLQEALKERNSLRKTNEELQSSLSVGYAKEQQLTADIERYKAKIQELVESTKVVTGLKARSTKLEESVNKLTESLKESNNTNTRLNRVVNLQSVNIKQLDRLNKHSEQENNRVSESLNNANQTIVKLQSEINKQRKLFESKLAEAKTSVKEDYEKRLEQAQELNRKLVNENDSLKVKLDRITESYTKNLCDAYDLDYDEVSDTLTNGTNADIKKLTESLARRKTIENRLPFATHSVKRINYTRPSDNMTEHRFTNNDDIAEWEINN